MAIVPICKNVNIADYSTDAALIELSAAAGCAWVASICLDSRHETEE